MGDTSDSNVIGSSMPHDYSSHEKIHYYAKPQAFNGYSTHFEWWKRKMYTYIIGLDDELLDLLKDGIEIEVNSVEWLLIERFSH